MREDMKNLAIREGHLGLADSHVLLYVGGDERTRRSHVDANQNPLALKFPKPSLTAMERTVQDRGADSDTCEAWFPRIAGTPAASNQHCRIRKRLRFV